MYKKLIRPLLFAFSAERAHNIVVAALRIAGVIPGMHRLFRRLWAVEHPSLEREVFGLRFRNPVGAAAGIDRNGEIFRELSAAGFGFVEVGTVTPRPEAGNPRPRMFRLPQDLALVNRSGRVNKGLERVIENLRHDHGDMVLGCNIGKNSVTPPENAAADYLKCFRRLYRLVDYFTVNISGNAAAHEFAPRTREQITAILEPLFDFRRGQDLYRPVLLKISPDMTDEEIDMVTDIMIQTPLDGIVAVNATASRDGLKSSRRDIAACGIGTLSGAPLTARAVEVVRRICRRSGGAYPVIATGGIMSPADVRAMFAAGASLVQLHTALVYEGPRIISDICSDLAADAAPSDTKTE